MPLKKYIFGYPYVKKCGLLSQSFDLTSSLKGLFNYYFELFSDIF